MSSANLSRQSFKIGVLISGRGSNLQALAKRAERGELAAEIAVVLSDKPTARGLEIAQAFGYPTRVVKRLPQSRSNGEFCAELASTLREYDLDLVVLAGFMRVLTEEFLCHYEGKVINIHPSLLPAFPGLDAQAQALQAGVRFSGCTVHYVEREVDAGPIIAQSVVAVHPNDSVDELASRILTQEHQILPAVVNGIARGEITLVNEGGCKKVLLSGHCRDLASQLGSLASIAEVQK